MPAYVALLRAVNVGGRAPLAMGDLRAVASQLGLRKPRTILQSGNLVFEADAAMPGALSARIAARLTASLSLATTVIVRSAHDWTALVADLPFADVARDDPAHLLAMPLVDVPDAARCAALQAAIRGRERIAVRGATAYLVYPDGIGRSKLTSASIERQLGTQGTGRNWRSVLGIAAALGA